nr:MAG TPA: hypothetical protein [Caudoviricetes sp.]
MAKYNIYLGGNKRVITAHGEAMMDSGLDPADQHVEYAAHLKTRHKTMQFYYDDGHEHMRMWYRQKGLGVLPVGDELGVILLAAGSFVNNIVFHNKKALPEGKLTIILNGVAGDAPANLAALSEKVQSAKDALAKAQAQANTDPTNTAYKTAVTNAKKALADAEKALAEANSKEVETFDVDLTQAGYTVLRSTEFLQSNGDITVKIKEGSLSGACFTVSASVENHNDQHGCSCYQAPCETTYPAPQCTRLPA